MRRFIGLMCVVLLVSFVGSTYAGLWVGGAGTTNWNDGGNWDSGIVPFSGEAAIIGAASLATQEPTIGTGVAAICSTALLGDPFGIEANPSGPFTLTVSGSGSLTVEGDMQIGLGGSSAILDVSGTASVAIGASLIVANGAAGTVNQTGGTVTSTNPIYLPIGGSEPSLYNLHGGVLSSSAISIGGTGVVDITEGTMLLSGDHVATMAFFVSLDRITAYGGTGTVVYDYNVTNQGVTTVTAIPEPATMLLLSLGTILGIKKRR